MTGVQTCALPIWAKSVEGAAAAARGAKKDVLVFSYGASDATGLDGIQIDS